ncbi:MAG: glycosyltransferase, partial [Planctomycetota bacterium]
MKIGMIGQKGIPATYGGIERAVEEVSSRLAARGHDVTVFVRPHYKTIEDTHRGIKIKVLPSLNTKHFDAISHTVVSTFYSLFDSFDVLHYHALGPSLLSFIPRMFGVPTAVTIHGLDWQRDKWGKVAKTVLKMGEYGSVHFPNVAVSVSKTLTEYLKKKYIN